MMVSRKVYGEIPGVPEGTGFVNRDALRAGGVHLPLMDGISGSATEAADSIVLSGGYEDDKDYGDLIIYTGQGGNDPKTGKQVRDQVLLRGNLGLVKSYLEGIPVRLVRGGQHRSPFSPAMGYRYDGLFRVECYWQEPGRSGYRIWRFRLAKINPSRDVTTAVRETRGDYDARPERREVYTQRIVRNTATAIQVKQMYDFRCQVCGIRLETPEGVYAEAAHIRPLGAPHNGPDTPDNIICLCPNHHVLFDVGAFTIDDDFRLIGMDGKLSRVNEHQINIEYLRYHRQHFG